MGNSCHFLYVPYSKKVKSQGTVLPQLAKESRRVGVLPGKDRGRTV